METSTFKQRIQEARDVAQESRKTILGQGGYGLFLRRFSIYVSYPLWKLGVTGNQVTVSMTICGLIGIACCIPHNIYVNLVGIFFCHFWYLLDYVDGEVARLRKQPTLMGIYLDDLSHIIMDCSFVLALGLHVCVLNCSIVNSFVVLVMYIGWYWKRATEYLLKTSLVVRGGLDTQPSKLVRPKRRKGLMRLLRRAVRFPAATSSVVYILSILVILSHLIPYEIIQWAFYFYTLLVWINAIGVMVRDGFTVRKLDRLDIKKQLEKS